ncbi:high affinity cationic amino acid transporter 1-like isoform X1 [Tachypleus tridentatus]|uniref:high affinity cationic amino acid transporter 1-like isoform X1 n=1 Tax=Tachypleus tridentatus TaxID=6853 RepID=UPI003FD55746
MGENLTTLWRILSRKKTTSCPGEGRRPLQRCLSIVDVTCLGLATTLGTGVYCLLGEAAREHTGPSVVLSYLIAAVASCLVGLCYSELATRFPRGGSAYVYSYSTFGEFFGFLIGWSMMLEYTIGAALAAKTWSQYFDVVSNGSLFHFFNQPLGVLGIPGLDRYPDVPAVLVIMTVTVGVMGKVKLGCIVNNALVFVNFLVIIGMVLVGMFNLDSENWTAGSGFFPHGVGGVFSAASVCFFAFVGYDVIATSGGEMMHRTKTLPGAVSFTFLIGLVVSFITATAVTLVIPCSLLDRRGPLLEAFEVRKIRGMKLFVIVGANCGLLSSVGTSLFALSRVKHSLANDGLLFQFLTSYNERTGTSWSACIVSASLSAIFAFFCDSRTLLEILGMGTLISFTSVLLSVLCLRYGVSEALPLELSELSRESTATLPLGGANLPSQNSYAEDYLQVVNASTQTSFAEENITTEAITRSNCLEYCSPKNNDYTNSVTGRPTVELISNSDRRRRNYGALHPRPVSVEFVNDTYVTSLTELSAQDSAHQKLEPTSKSAVVTAVLVAAVITIIGTMGVITMHVPYRFAQSRWWIEVIFSFLMITVVVCVGCIIRQPHHKPRYKNSVTCIPVLPLCALWMTIHLMASLSYISWLAFLFWSLLGILEYLAYGVWHSTERGLDDSVHVALLDVMEDPSGGAAYHTNERQALVNVS